MANTVIQIKRSAATAAPTNGSLAAAEPAYSFNSNKLFIGNTAGTGVVEIGGKYWVDVANFAAITANAGFTTTNAAYTTANAGYTNANSAYGTANLAYTNSNSAYGTANAGYTNANAAYGTANAGYTNANSAYTTANAGYVTANAAYTNSNAAFLTANNALAQAGGTITGDLVVQGNATFSGLTTYANTQTLLVGDNIFVLNADLPVASAPSENAGMEINRGSSSNVGIIWNEGTDKWTFTNDGSSYLNIASNSDVTSATVSANAYAVAVGAASNTWANTVGTSGNAYTVTVGAASNTWANTVGTAGNAYTVSVGAASNTWANTVGTSGNAYTVTVGAASNTWANTVGVAGNNYTNTSVASANAYTNTMIAVANTNAANASYLSTGTVPSGRLTGSYTGITGVGTLTVGTWNASTVTVPYGGTGITTATANGVILGNGTNAFQVTAAGTDGQVLQVAGSGAPAFGMLDGGVF